MSPALVDLTAYRGTPFIDVTDFEGYDYSAATFVMEIRAYRDAAGSPLVALANASSSAQGISCTVTEADGISTSAIRILINETTLEALNYTNPRGGNLELEYALDITGGGHLKARRMQGKFILEASANG